MSNHIYFYHYFRQLWNQFQTRCQKIHQYLSNERKFPCRMVNNDLCTYLVMANIYLVIELVTLTICYTKYLGGKKAFVLPLGEQEQLLQLTYFVILFFHPVLYRHTFSIWTLVLHFLNAWIPSPLCKYRILYRYSKIDKFQLYFGWKVVEVSCNISNT